MCSTRASSIADEPTAGLDVSIQGDLLNLMADLQQEFGLTYLIVSHNLNVVRKVTDRVAVMYLGQIVEIGRTATVFSAPAHPYSYALISANPEIDPAKRREKIVLAGEIPSPLAPPSGLPLPHALPAHAGALPSRGAKAARYGWGAIRRVPLSAGARVTPTFNSNSAKSLRPNSRLRTFSIAETGGYVYLSAISRAIAGAEVGTLARAQGLPPRVTVSVPVRLFPSRLGLPSSPQRVHALKPSGQRWNAASLEAAAVSQGP